LKKYTVVISFLIVVGAIYTTFYNRLPQKINPENAPKTEFSAERALIHVKNISKTPHYLGSPGHLEVRSYIIEELQKLGLQTGIHQGVNSGDRGNLCKVTNIMARIKGSSKGKALVLLSHYDSSPHSSFGASDDASGVATILEGVRAYLASGKKPVNDIIILITDGEELGLNGAELFVEKHPWAEDAALVLNFEARGSGGPAYMLVETNGGNSKLITEFAKAGTSYPVGNSLAYSIYKMLPNDTDLTVFREQKNIDGFNFAFIDDHFDYHSALDNYDRLDKNTAGHLGSYLMPLLDYFSTQDISSLKASADYIYFTVPFFKIVYYPFSWIWPLLGAAFLLFIIILSLGIKKGSISLTDVFKGFIPFLTSLIICLLVGYFAHTLLYGLYPEYNEILHKFPYNGYTYIAAFTLLFISVGFFSYGNYKKLNTASLLVAPIFFWLILCTLTALYLKGAGFFIIPAFASLTIFYMVSVKERTSLIFITLLGVPVIWLLAPLIQVFPVGLGFKMQVGSTLFSPMVLSALLTISGFGLLIGTFHRFPKLKRLGYFSLLVAMIFFISAHFDADFTKDKPQPSSLVYLHDGNTNKSYWATYDGMPNEWVKQYLNNQKKVKPDFLNTTFSSKYKTPFTYASEASVKRISAPEIIITQDTLINEKRHLEICIKPKRTVNRLSVFTEKGTVVNSCEINGSVLSKKFLESIPTRKRLITHFIRDNDYTEIKMVVPSDQKTTLHIFEASYDLLRNELFSVPARPENSIPKPFVLNDAIIIKKTVQFE
jgi:hypothetical protein